MTNLSQLLKKKKFPNHKEAFSEDELKSFQLKLLRIQQGLWHSKKRAILVFEGFDASGKGGSIRQITEVLDPRSFRVYPIGPPTPSEQGKHYLYRFWRKIPSPGKLAIFDRSWYGRILVERVDHLTPKKRWQEAYKEINQFEEMLVNDGVDVIKIFLAIHPKEQLKRFADRIQDPYKQWKLTEVDLKAHRQWKKYVKASDDLFLHTSTKKAPWNLIPADSKEYAQGQVLKHVTESLSHHAHWIESAAEKRKTKDLQKSLEKLGL